MPTDEEIRGILTANKVIAVVGMSTNPEKPARRVPARMHTLGYTIIPVNPNTERIIGLKSYPTLADVEKDVDIVNVWRPSEVAAEVVKAAVKRHRERGDVKVVWLQEGITSEEGRKLAEEAGLDFVEDRCVWKEHRRVVGEGK